MGNLAKLVNSERTKLLRILTGQKTCRLCGERSVAAVETFSGYKPACREHAEQVEKSGRYLVVWTLAQLESKPDNE